MAPLPYRWIRRKTAPVTPYYYQGRNPLLHYWLDEGSGNLTDKGSLGVTLTKIGTPVYSQTSRVSGSSSILCGSYGGATEGCFSSETGLTATVAATDSLTMFFRYKVHPSDPEDWTYSYLFDAYTGASYPRISVYFDGSERLCAFMADDANNYAGGAFADSKALAYTAAKSDWVEIAVVFDRHLGIIAYVQGALLGTHTTGWSSVGACTFSGHRLNLGVGYGATSWQSAFHGYIDEAWVVKGRGGWWDNVNQRNNLTLQEPSRASIHYIFDVASGNVTDLGDTGVTLTAYNTTNLQYRETGQGPSLPYKISNVYGGSGSKGYFASTSPPHTDVDIAAGDDLLQLIQMGFPSNHNHASWAGHFGVFNLYNLIGGETDSDFDSYFMPAAPTEAEWSAMFKDDSGNRHQVHLLKADGYDAIRDSNLHEIVWKGVRGEKMVRWYIDNDPVPAWTASGFSLFDALTDNCSLDGGRSMMTVDQLHTNWMGGAMAEYFLAKGANAADWYRNYPAHYEAATTKIERQGGTPYLHFKFLEPASDGYLMNYGSVATGKLTPHGTFTRSVPAPANLWYGINYGGGASHYKNPAAPMTLAAGADFILVGHADYSAGVTGAEKYMWRLVEGATNCRFFGWLDVATKRFKIQLRNSGGTTTYQAYLAQADFYDLLLAGRKEFAFGFDRSETSMWCKVNNVTKSVVNETGTLSALVGDDLVYDAYFIGAFTIGDEYSHFGSLYEWWLSPGLTYTSNY